MIVMRKVWRMKNYGWLFVVVLLAGSCVPKEDVILRAVNIREVGVGIDGDPVLKADAIFYNPNATRMKLKRIDIDVFVDGKKAASIDQHLNALIKANAEFSVPLEVQLKLKEIGLLNTLLNLFGGKKYEILFVGKMKVTVNGFPVTFPVNYKEALTL
jgi:hypothetical protein